MSARHRLLIVEDHTLLRAGLSALLAQDPKLEIVGEANNGRDAVRLIGALKPHLVLMDLSMPGINGIEAIKDIKRRYPEVRVLVLTAHKTEEYVHASLRAGADGYLIKEATHDELLIAVQTLLSGKTYLSRDVAAKVVGGLPGNGGRNNAGQAAQTTGPWDTLTERERQILKLVAEGNTNKVIADYLCLSVKTVEKHRSNLMKKLDIHNASALTAYAIEKGLHTVSTAIAP